MFDKMTTYKVLGPDRHPYHGGSGQWPPPGEWHSSPGPLVLCEPGTLHLLRGEEQLVRWLGPEIWEAETEGEVAEGDDKIGCLRARLVRRYETWNDRTARLFACDCAERALLRERSMGREPDSRSWAAIDVARRYADGLANVEELYAAELAASAAWSAAQSAAQSAARSAAQLAASAAWSAAQSAARSAARSAAQSAARSVRLAAWSAAWSAAQSAAQSARSAWSAEICWQANRLRWYLDGEVA